MDSDHEMGSENEDQAPQFSTKAKGKGVDRGGGMDREHDETLPW
jgi:hypothetical protein